MQFGFSLPITVTPSSRFICNQGRVQQATLSLQYHGLPQMPEPGIWVNVADGIIFRNSNDNICLKEQRSEPASYKQHTFTANLQRSFMTEFTKLSVSAPQCRTVGLLLNDDLVTTTWKEEGEKSWKNLNQDIQYPDRNSKRLSLEYEPKTLPLSQHARYAQFVAPCAAWIC
jgi:hypothetical protein